MALQGPIPVEFGTVFPHGVYAAGEFEPVRDFDRSQGDRFVQQADKATGAPLWAVEVIDADPQARARTVKVKVMSAQQPVLPPRHGRGAVRGGGVHRADGHALRQSGGAAGVLGQGDRGAPGRPSRWWPSGS